MSSYVKCMKCRKKYTLAEMSARPRKENGGPTSKCNCGGDLKGTIDARKIVSLWEMSMRMADVEVWDVETYRIEIDKKTWKAVVNWAKDKAGSLIAYQGKAPYVFGARVFIDEK